MLDDGALIRLESQEIPWYLVEVDVDTHMTWPFTAHFFSLFFFNTKAWDTI
jgi:hypothetical protein